MFSVRRPYIIALLLVILLAVISVIYTNKRYPPQVLPSANFEQLSQVVPSATPPASQPPPPASSSTNNPSQVEHLFDITGAPSAKALAFAPGRNELWATLLLNKNKGISVYEASTGKKITDINLASGGGVEIIFSRDGSRAYVSQMESASVFEIDTDNKKVLRQFKTKGNWTKVMALSADGTRLYASHWISNNISEIDLGTGREVRLIPTVVTPRGLYATQDGQFLYVAGFDNGDIQKINLATLERTLLFKTGGAMRHIVGDESRGILYVSDMAKNMIYTVSLKDDSIKEFAATDNNPNTIALTPDKKILVVSNRGINSPDGNYYIPGPEWGSVLFFDTSSGKMLDAVIGGNQPTALDISPDSMQVAFSDFLDARIQMLKIPRYEELLTSNGGRSFVYKSQLKK